MPFSLQSGAALAVACGGAGAVGFPSVRLGVPSSQELSAVGAVVAEVVGWDVFCPGAKPPAIAQVVLAAAPNGEGWCFCCPKRENPCPVVGDGVGEE